MSAVIELQEMILASASRFRADCLHSAGLKFSSVKAPINESLIEADTPTELALARANAKAKSLAETSVNAVIIGADQVLDLDGRSFGKVQTKTEAAERLKQLSGKTHRLRSAYAIYLTGNKVGDTVPTVYHCERCVSASMKMRELSSKDIEAYLSQSFEWQGVVGCYMFEKRGVGLFEQVDGDQSTIIGLPLVALLADLRKVGIDQIVSPHAPWMFRP